MDRYYPEHIRVHQIKEARIWAKTTDYHGCKEKEHIILTRRQYSFLYIDDIRDLGKKKERVIRGTILDIKQIPLYNIKNAVPSYMTPGISNFNQRIEHCRPDSEATIDTTTIVVDASEEYESKIEELKVSNILDVNSIDFNYDPKEDTRLVPGYDKKLTLIEDDIKEEIKPKTPPEVVTGEKWF